MNDSPYLTMDVLESCFPYALLRNAYHEVYKVTPFSLQIKSFLIIGRKAKTSVDTLAKFTDALK